MAKERNYISVMEGYIPRGYIKSVSYKNRTFKTTQSKMDAKGYKTNDALMHDIDVLTTPETVARGVTFHLV